MPAMFVHLINKYTDHEATLIQNGTFVYGNPLDVKRTMDSGEIINAINNADILHFHGVAFDKKRICNVKLMMKYYSKPLVLHYHGTPHRESPARYRRPVPLLVSTPEMLPLFPGSQYFPNLIDETHPMYVQRKERTEERKIRVCHHYSTHKDKKDTNWFTKARNHFENNGKNIDFNFIGKMDLVDALQARAENDIVFDHFQGYYGCVSLEAMAQGLMVINGCSLDTQRALKTFFGELPPFCMIDKREFIPALKNFSHSPETIEHYGRLGRKFVKDRWSGERNIRRLTRFYEEVIKQCHRQPGYTRRPSVMSSTNTSQNQC